MDKVFKYLMNESKITNNDTIVIGVSGGPDSMMLLHLMIELRKQKDIKLICAHINHNVRKESIKELQFVKEYCSKNNIIFETMTLDKIDKNNFHQVARTIRYDFFKVLIKKYNAKFLMTAHHGDDLIETILMRLVRGSSLRGYAGFTRETKMVGYKIIRPLISITKEDILSYCKINKLKYVSDLSNQKDMYTRNRFRKYVLPALKKEDINVHDKFYKFSQLLNEYNDYVDKQVTTIIKNVCTNNEIDITKFLKQPHLIQTKIIYNILEGIYNNDLSLVSDIHVELILNLINSKKVNATVSLPNDVVVIKQYDKINFSTLNLCNGYSIELKGKAEIPNGKNIAIVSDSDETNNNICRLNSKDISLPLYVRTRTDGDKINVKGMIGHKKINDIFIDKKIVKKERDMWPVVVDSNNNIVWLPGLKKSKFDKLKSERYDIILKYY